MTLDERWITRCPSCGNLSDVKILLISGCVVCLKLKKVSVKR
jgi:hypothetical protein